MKKIFPLLILFFACQKSQTQSETPKEIVYESTPQGFSLSSSIKEASGITYSKSIPGHLWVNEDSGNPPMLYLLKNDGTLADSLNIVGATNRDWEEITIGVGPEAGKSYLYVGDIGDNDAKYLNYTIYRFPEPAAGVKEVTVYDKIVYTYADGARDAEAFLIDDKTGDIFIISKRDTKSRLYKLPFPQSASSPQVAEFVMELGYTSVVSAATSPGGEEIIVKTYMQVYHYEKDAAIPASTVFQSEPKMLAYQLEPQGEAVTFAADGSGFYTLSEEARGVVPKLFFYKKK